LKTGRDRLKAATLNVNETTSFLISANINANINENILCVLQNVYLIVTHTQRQYMTSAIQLQLNKVLTIWRDDEMSSCKNVASTGSMVTG